MMDTALVSWGDRGKQSLCHALVEGAWYIRKVLISNHLSLVELIWANLSPAILTRFQVHPAGHS